MTHHSRSSAAHRIALGLELGVATARDLTERATPGPTVADQIAHIGLQLLTILTEPAGLPIERAQRNAREACHRLRTWLGTGADGRGAFLNVGERYAIDRLLRDVAVSLSRFFGYSADERAELRITVLGETAAAAAERVRQQDIDAAAGHDPGWRWSLGECDEP